VLPGEPAPPNDPVPRALMSPVLVTRCICQRMPFDRLLPLARRHGWDLADLMRETGCGDQCGLCRPYLRAMLADGRTVFHELLAEEPRA
jgi:bacterioferritin-associated ferredoxin